MELKLMIYQTQGKHTNMIYQTQGKYTNHYNTDVVQ
jgi:hypothetical protein